MRPAEMGEEIKAKAHQTVFGGNDQHRNPIGDDTIHHGKEFGPREVQAPAYLAYPLRHAQPSCRTKLL